MDSTLTGSTVKEETAINSQVQRLKEIHDKLAGTRNNLRAILERLNGPTPQDANPEAGVDSHPGEVGELCFVVTELDDMAISIAGCVSKVRAL